MELENAIFETSSEEELTWPASPQTSMQWSKLLHGSSIREEAFAAPTPPIAIDIIDSSPGASPPPPSPTHTTFGIDSAQRCISNPEREFDILATKLMYKLTDLEEDKEVINFLSRKNNRLGKIKPKRKKTKNEDGEDLSVVSKHSSCVETFQMDEETEDISAGLTRLQFHTAANPRKDVSKLNKIKQIDGLKRSVHSKRSKTLSGSPSE